MALERVRERDGEGRREAAALERAVDALERLAEVVERRRRGPPPVSSSYRVARGRGDRRRDDLAEGPRAAWASR